jgi:hypothetical protein
MNNVEAKLLFEEFLKKYSHSHKEYDQELKKYLEKIHHLDEEKKEDLKERFESNEYFRKNILTLQSFFKGIMIRDTHITVSTDVKDNQTFINYSSEVLHVLNKQKGVKRSLNKNKLNVLKSALDNADWKDTIFSDSELPYLAMTLYGSAQLTQQQFFTLLEYKNIEEVFDIQNIYPILDEDGKWTKEAEEFLLPSLQNKSFAMNLQEDEAVEAFRLLVQTLPKSEQIFYKTNNKLKTGENSLFNQLNNHLQMVPQHQESFIHLTNGGWHALGLSKFGKQYAPYSLRFGKFTPMDIKESVFNDERYADIFFPNVDFEAKPHNCKSPAWIRTLHDKFHAYDLSKYPILVRKALKQFMTIIEMKTGYALSHEIWMLIDTVFTLKDNVSISDNFTTLITKFNKGSITKIYTSFDFNCLFFVELIENEKIWDEFNINISSLSKDFLTQFDIFKKFYSLFKNDTFPIQCLKYKIIMEALEINKNLVPESFKSTFEAINRIESDIKIERLCFKNLKNVLCLTYQGKPIIKDNILGYLYGDKKGAISVYLKNGIPSNNKSFLNTIIIIPENINTNEIIYQPFLIDNKGNTILLSIKNHNGFNELIKSLKFINPTDIYPKIFSLNKELNLAIENEEYLIKEQEFRFNFL